MKFTLQKGAVDWTSSGITSAGIRAAEQYATRWVQDAVRDLDLERAHPDLVGLFYDIRIDPELARVYASPNTTPLRKAQSFKIRG